MSVLQQEGYSIPLGALQASLRTDAPTPTIFDERILDLPDAAEFLDSVIAFYHSAVPHACHEASIRRAGPLLRYSLAHLLRGTDPLPQRFARCLSPDGPFFIAGLGRTFWSAVAQSLAPRTLPRWLPSVEAGARRVGLIAARTLPASIAPFTELCAAYQTLACTRPAWELDDLLARIATMSNREVPPSFDPTADLSARIAMALREVRTVTPLRHRLKHYTPQSFALSPTAWRGLREVDDAFVEGLTEDDVATLLLEVIAQLRDRFRVHSLEINDLLERLVVRSAKQGELARPFHGFCSDSFQFLHELAANNNRDWMDTHRERYHFAVREPMIELCEALAERYVWPILHKGYGWELECAPRTGKALTSIVKNDYGQSSPYVPEMWVTFHRSGRPRNQEAQLFVRLTADGLTCGLQISRTARDAGRRLRATIQQHGPLLFATLTGRELQFGDLPLKRVEELRAWAAQKTLVVSQFLRSDKALLRSDELVGELMLTFDRLVPLFAAAVAEDPLPLLRERTGHQQTGTIFNEEAFESATLLSAVWLDRVRGLLKAKKQLVLRGVSGTGKTHVAKNLARLLTRDRGEAVRFVQFHPSYTYEEFVERPDGDTFRDGVLLTAAAEANRQPAESFVLLIDELTRANLPRVFGELLYLLEYRGEAVTLPYSKRTFRLPSNLLILATANPTDPAADTLDQPLRRRFAFVDMPPDSAVLARWFAVNPPADTDPTFGPRVLKLFEQLNARIARDCGKEWQIGHTPFMVPLLDRDKLATLWKHHLTPLLDARRGSADLLASFERLFAPTVNLS